MPRPLVCLLLAAAWLLTTPLFAADKKASHVVVDLYVDRQENRSFLQAQEEEAGFNGFVYGMARKPNPSIDIQLANKELMGIWKGNATIRSDTSGSTRELFDEANQFAPVLLVVDPTNTGRKSTQITGGYLEVARSQPDLQPYMTAFGSGGGPYCSGEEKSHFEVDVGFRNWGWGPAENATANFSFANASNDKGDDVHEEPIGGISHVQTFSILNALERSGVNVDRLKSTQFECPSLDEVETCIKALAHQGLFGKLSEFVFSQGFLVSIRTLGAITYTWHSSQGETHQRRSPFSVDVVVLEFNRSGPECGAAGPVEREYNTVKLSLNRSNYRIPLNYKGKLKPKQNRRFALALVADKSSQHVFKVVLTLADGTTVASPAVDLLYFMPRFFYTN